MTDFIYPLATVILDFICVLFCIRISVSKREPIWLLPMVLSLALFPGGVICLLAIASNTAGENLSRIASYASIYLFLISLFWVITIIAFASRAKSKREMTSFQKAYNEAEYVKKRTAPRYRKLPDMRISAKSRVKAVSESLQKAQTARLRQSDLYGEGQVSTVRMKRTSFSQKAE